MYEEINAAGSCDPSYLAKQQIGRYEKPTRRFQLEQKKQMLEFELKRVQAGLDALDGNPQLEQFFDVVQQAL